VPPRLLAASAVDGVDQPICGSASCTTQTAKVPTPRSSRSSARTPRPTRTRPKAGHGTRDAQRLLEAESIARHLLAAGQVFTSINGAARYLGRQPAARHRRSTRVRSLAEATPRQGAPRRLSVRRQRSAARRRQSISTISSSRPRGDACMTCTPSPGRREGRRASGPRTDRRARPARRLPVTHRGVMSDADVATFTEYADIA
jgi:hypothetical protein